MKRSLTRKLTKGRWRRTIGMALFYWGWRREKRELANYEHSPQAWAAASDEATQILGHWMLKVPAYTIGVRVWIEPTENGGRPADNPRWMRMTAAPTTWRRGEIVRLLRTVADDWEEGRIAWHDELVEQMRAQKDRADQS